MTDKQPEALRLADAIDPFVRQAAPDHLTSTVAAAELRRLHEENEALQHELRLERTVSFRSQVHEQADRINALETANKELLEALERAVANSPPQLLEYWGRQARAAIAKHGETK